MGLTRAGPTQRRGPPGQGRQRPPRERQVAGGETAESLSAARRRCYSLVAPSSRGRRHRCCNRCPGRHRCCQLWWCEEAPAGAGPPVARRPILGRGAPSPPARVAGFRAVARAARVVGSRAVARAVARWAWNGQTKKGGGRLWWGRRARARPWRWLGARLTSPPWSTEPHRGAAGRAVRRWRRGQCLGDAASMLRHAPIGREGRRCRGVVCGEGGAPLRGNEHA